MPASPEQIEIISVVDPFQTAGFSEPSVESSESSEPVDPSVDRDPLIKQWASSLSIQLNSSLKSFFSTSHCSLQASLAHSHRHLRLNEIY